MERPMSALRRKSQVYVEIPPSLIISSKSSRADRVVQQENTPLRAVAINVDRDKHPPSSTSKPLKRKSLDTSQGDCEVKHNPSQPKFKKAKTEDPTKSVVSGEVAKTAKASAVQQSAKPQQDTVRCHQCTRQVDPSAAAHCTYLRPSGQQCVLKYCRACMRNRYEQDIHTIKTEGTDVPSEERSKHASAVDYLFRCPRCRTSCNCRACRKAKGLPATGDLSQLDRKAAKANHETQLNVPKNIAPKPNGASTSVLATLEESGLHPLVTPHAFKPKPHVLIPPSSRYEHLNGPNGHVQNQKRRTASSKPEVAPKPVPKPLWTRIPTPLDYEEALQRINVREFLLRFSHLTDVSRGHLEELEELGGERLGEVSREEQDGNLRAFDVATWIPEVSVKAILIGLLTLLSRDPDLQGDALALSKALQNVKTAGASLNKMWIALATLRANSSIRLPDPLPPVASAAKHSTRSGTLAQAISHSSVMVHSTAQFVPVVSALIDRSLQTTTVREDFDRAVAHEKDLARAARELIAEENARWKTLNSKGITSEERRARRVAHKDALAAIEHAQRVAMVECIPRFAPLGRDTEGRVYYALTPGVIEREAAVDLLEGGKGEIKLGKRRGVADEVQRKRMRHWSWLLAVWGRKPEDVEVAKSREERDDDCRDDQGGQIESGEGWWGFWQPEEVAKLSDWLADKIGVNVDAKQPYKEPYETTPVDEKGSGQRVNQRTSRDKPRGRLSNARSAAGSYSTSSRRGLRTFASLNRDSSNEDNEVSPTADSSDEEDNPRMGLGSDSREEPLLRREDITNLVKGLKDYAQLLEWRIKRASKESKDRADNAEKNEKGKSVAKDNAIPAQTFYGK
ncbi:hypothetical protein BD414DRAFT_576506 [Trametes punicea]|nr:hypothetical protein BD414DRAFT_576506 [Trametes punicea]